MTPVSNELSACVSEYRLLDSGAGEKLERFGNVTLRRPSSLAIWHKRLSARDWGDADATFLPNQGWKSRKKLPDSWRMGISDFSIELRTQRNGQVGVFPDHISYLPDLVASGEAIRRSAKAPKALNLFAYTGMATVALSRCGYSVCHVDLSKSALNWARTNVELNAGRDSNDGHTRFVPEDALKFVEREVKRGSRYDLILADPPSFGRISKAKHWRIEEIVTSLISNCFQLLNEGACSFFLTCHHAAFGPEVLFNLLADGAGSRQGSLTARSLSVSEQDSERKLPAGYMASFTGHD